MALLAVPVELAFYLRIERGFEARLSIGWLFGLVRFPVRLNGDKSTNKLAKRRRKQARKRRKAGRRGRQNVFIRADFWQWLRWVLRRLMRRIQIVQLFLRVRLGLDDPADTGRLWAVAGPVAAGLASIPVTDIRLEPNFMEEEFVLLGEGEVRFIPIRVVASALAIALSPATWRLFRQTGAKR